MYPASNVRCRERSTFTRFTPLFVNSLRFRLQRLYGTRTSADLCECDHDQGGEGGWRRRSWRLKEYSIPEMKSTALPLLVVLGSLYLWCWWPSLCAALFKWVLGLVGVVGVLIGLAMKLHSFESLATQGELFPGMSTAKCWNFGHIGVAPSSASSCKVSSTPRAPPAPLLRSFGLWGAPAPLRHLPRQDPPHRAHESSLVTLGLHTYGSVHTRPLAAGVRGEDPKGGCPLGPRIQLASRRCGVAPPCLHRPTRSVDRVRPHDSPKLRKKTSSETPIFLYSTHLLTPTAREERSGSLRSGL